MSQVAKKNQDAGVKCLHGSSSKSRAGIAALCGKDAAMHQIMVDKYFDNWSDAARNDLQQEREARRKAYIDVTGSYYNIVTDMFEHLFFGQSFHFYRILRGQSLIVASRQHERYLASKLNLRPGQKVLDVGCGVGGPAKEIARFGQVNIVGLNYNDYQIQRGIRYMAEAGLQDKVSFVQGDFMQKNFEPNSFDAAYSIEGTSYAPSLKGVYSEIYKALKPGGILAVYELIMTDDYNDDDPEHFRLRCNLERGIGVPALAKISDAIKALKDAGFELKEAEDLARRPNEIPWYYPWSGSIYLNSFWDAGRIFWGAVLGSGFMTWVMRWGEKIRLFPSGCAKVGQTLVEARGHVIKAGEQNLFTPIFILVGQKPSN